MNFRVFYIFLFSDGFSQGLQRVDHDLVQLNPQVWPPGLEPASGPTGFLLFITMLIKLLLQREYD
jgi:hypothetical protein